MKSVWLHRKGRNGLIIFCNGWGMDEHPFTPLASRRWDVLMFCDYADLTPDLDLDGLFEAYGEVVLVGWSMGVWAGQQIFSPYRRQLKNALAINGTLCPIDDNFGIPEEIVRATLDNFDEEQRLKFYQRMCRDRKLYHSFLENQPLRGMESQKRELAHLLKATFCQPAGDSIYQHALVAERDYIMATANQLRFWPEKRRTRVDGYHFLFYIYGSWDEIVAAADGREDTEEQGGIDGFAS